MPSISAEETTPVTVLFVDDEPVIADTMCLILRQCGITAAAAYDGAEAIEMARRYRPKVIFMNVVMPVDGVQSAKQIRQEFPEIAIVMHSGAEAADEYVRKNGLGACIPKPFTPQKLFEALAEHGIRRAPSKASH